MQNIFSDFFLNCQHRVNAALDQVLPAITATPSHLHSAMRYAVLEGGKRIRPTLVYATGELFNAPASLLDDAACAIELIHCYSLVHDDLPAMDNDTLRRGKPTCHVAYGEATAILAGDALQSLAFQCLANTNLIMVKTLAYAAGSQGMAGGQEIDITSTGKQLDLQALQQMHEYKTGALIIAAVLLGAYASPQISPEQLSALTQYAKKIGLAFQVYDDVLDAESTTEVLGKTAGADAAHNKPTYTHLLGAAKAQSYALELAEEAQEALQIFGSHAEHLRALAHYAVTRAN